MLRLLLCSASYVAFNENCVKQFLLHRFCVNARFCGRIALVVCIQPRVIAERVIAYSYDFVAGK
jgi:hypothetical protein